MQYVEILLLKKLNSFDCNSYLPRKKQQFDINN